MSFSTCSKWLLALLVSVALLGAAVIALGPGQTPIQEMVKASDEFRDMLPAPIPGENVLAGTPIAYSRTLGQSPDGKLSFNLWEVSAGRFRWSYPSDEVVHVLGGGMTVTPESPGGGPPRTYATGDVAYFPRGLVAVWEVPDHVRKLAIHRSVQDPFMHRVYRRLARLFAAP